MNYKQASISLNSFFFIVCEDIDEDDGVIMDNNPKLWKTTLCRKWVKPKGWGGI